MKLSTDGLYLKLKSREQEVYELRNDLAISKQCESTEEEKKLLLARKYPAFYAVYLNDVGRLHETLDNPLIYSWYVHLVLFPEFDRLHSEGKLEENSLIIQFCGKNVTYTGQTLNGKPHGKGSITMSNGNKIETTFINGVEHGLRRMTFPSG